MRLPLIKYGNIALTIKTIHPVLSPSCLIFLVRLGGYIVNSLDSYSYRLFYRLIGKQLLLFIMNRESES
jgi:hypothetical protein